MKKTCSVQLSEELIVVTEKRDAMACEVLSRL